MIVPRRYYVGDTVPITVNYQTSEDEDVDPASVSLEIRSPYGTVAAYTYGIDEEVERVNTGDYLCEFSPDYSGRWHYRWVSTGIGTATVREGTFVIQATAFDTNAVWDPPSTIEQLT